MIANLNAMLSSRRQYVDTISDISQGEGAASDEAVELRMSLAQSGASKYAGVQYDKSDTGFTGLVNQGGRCFLIQRARFSHLVPRRVRDGLRVVTLVRSSIASGRHEHIPHEGALLATISCTITRTFP
jgi:hypothetical protein